MRILHSLLHAGLARRTNNATAHSILVCGRAEAACHHRRRPDDTFSVPTRHALPGSTTEEPVPAPLTKSLCSISGNRARFISTGYRYSCQPSRWLPVTSRIGFSGIQKRALCGPALLQSRLVSRGFQCEGAVCRFSQSLRSLRPSMKRLEHRCAPGSPSLASSTRSCRNEWRSISPRL